MSKGTAWSQVHEVVGHISGSDRKVTLWVIIPFLLEVDVVATYDREARGEGHVETGGTNDGIHVSLLTVGCQKTRFGEGLDTTPDNLDLGGTESFQVAVSGCCAPTAVPSSSLARRVCRSVLSSTYPTANSGINLSAISGLAESFSVI